MTLPSPCIDPPAIKTSRLPHVPHGVLIVNKPDGWTSHDVVMRVRAVLGIQKVGHAGTLDPHATGVLPILIGKGTKVAQYLLDWDKEYLAVLQLGQKTDTQDAWGTLLEDVPCNALSEDDVRSAFNHFHGTIQQVPPMYSAVKVAGQPLYKKARKGQTVERQAKSVVIHDLEIQRMDLPEVSFRVACSKGTYVRTLCEDIGDRLGVGGHLKWLQRSRVGPLRLDQALNMESITDVLKYDGAFCSLDHVLGGFPVVTVNGDDARKVLHGNAIPWSRVERTEEEVGIAIQEENRRVRVKSKDGDLLALGKGPSLQSGQSGTVLVIDTLLA
jgi:tRNA pseudouridine55 synthase